MNWVYDKRRESGYASSGPHIHFGSRMVRFGYGKLVARFHPETRNFECIPFESSANEIEYDDPQNVMENTPRGSFDKGWRGTYFLLTTSVSIPWR
jgi:hypothetical protein